jgi:hypothetical protein
VREGAGTSCGLETIAYLHPFDGLNTHQGCSEAGVKATIPVHVGTQARRQSSNNYFNYSPEGVAILVRLINFRHHRYRRLRIRTPQRVLVKALHI